MPLGIPFIIGNEAAERFSYYGMSAILVVFMTEHMLTTAGQPDHMTEDQAKTWYHTFVSAAYFLPLIGAVVADAFLGKFKTIFWLSLVYCLGHFALALNDTRMGLMLGLSLIAIGAGGIKPCVSANVGDQFGARNQHLLPKVFSWFYFSINFGSFFSTILTPWLLDHPRLGPKVAFGVPGVFMLIATVFFWLGRKTFVRVPPAGREFVREVFSLKVLKGIAGLVPVFLSVAVFWALWNQTMSAWVLQAKKMDLNFLGLVLKPAQVQAVNPILILVLIPLSAYVLYPLVDRFFKLTPLRKISIGLFLTVPSFLLTAWIEQQIGLGLKPNIAWQFLAYLIISQAEVMVSITCLEFSYTEAPKKLKSFIMAFYLLSISLGNGITALINYLIQMPNGGSMLSGPAYYNFFAHLMALTALGFILIATRYKQQN